jgi:hypothetical protein
MWEEDMADMKEVSKIEMELSLLTERFEGAH